MIAIDPYSGNYFYYTDGYNDYYIKGYFKEKAENVYYISCSNVECKDIIPDQEIVNTDRSFIMTVDGIQITFKKPIQRRLFMAMKITTSRDSWIGTLTRRGYQIGVGT